MTRRLVGRSREFRQKPTRSEALLWEALRNRALGVKFYRQKIIGPFVPDFVSERPKLIIEIDGPVHDELMPRDEERERYLEAQGYAVLRFRSDDVEHRLERVLETVANYLNPLNQAEPLSFSVPAGGDHRGTDVDAGTGNERVPRLRSGRAERQRG